MLHVVRKDGSSFRVPPSKVGVEGELYTRIDTDGFKDREIEAWFDREIENPFAHPLKKILNLEGIEKRKYPSLGNEKQRKELQELGFLIDDFEERLLLSERDRSAVVNYVAALLVRNPSYLSKLEGWHRDNNEPATLPVDPTAFRGFALENMLYLFEVYREVLAKGFLNLVIAECDREFLYVDGGVTAKEPWNRRPIPFDLYAPLTPKFALNLLPMPNVQADGLWITRINSRGVARYNRTMLANASRFVFSRSSPPLAFIAKHFGVAAPSPFGSRWVNGQLETIYNRSRDRPL